MAKILFHYPKIELLKCLRQLHISLPYNGQAKIMKKIMGGNAKKKSKYFEAPPLPTPKAFTKGAFEGKRSANSKRTVVLNKLFMRYITDLMSTGDCSSKFVGYGIEIDRVQITPDFNCVNVFWFAKDPEKNDIIESILHKNSGHLRHELAQLKVVGVIPKIRFIKDKHSVQAVKVDQLLAVADYGDDHSPTDTATKLKSQLELNMNLELHITEKISTLEDSEEIYEEPIPSMPNIVFGLNHLEIMERIRKSKQKSQALHRLHPQDTEAEILQVTNENPIRFASVNAEREAFREFLHKQQILRNKANKLNKNYTPDVEYMKEEWLQKQKMYEEDSFENKINNEDFIEEDEDIK